MIRTALATTFAVFAAGFGDTVEARIIGLLGALAGVFLIARIVLRYERMFIEDQSREIVKLRVDVKEAKDEAAACHAERAADRHRIDKLERELARLRHDFEA